MSDPIIRTINDLEDAIVIPGRVDCGNTKLSSLRDGKKNRGRVDIVKILGANDQDNLAIKLIMEPIMLTVQPYVSFSMEKAV